MKPIAQVEKRAGWDRETREPKDLHRVALVPSHEDGHFVVDHSHYGRVVADRVVLLDVGQEDVETMHATGEFPLDRYVSTDEQGNSTVEQGQINIPFNRGSGNSVSATVTTFREFAPVTPEVSAGV